MMCIQLLLPLKETAQELLLQAVDLIVHHLVQAEVFRQTPQLRLLLQHRQDQFLQDGILTVPTIGVQMAEALAVVLLLTQTQIAL
jgi:hypothetical protein